jgi:serine/threonine-protein kinase
LRGSQFEALIVKLKLIVVEGPHQGREFLFHGRDSFLVGRANEAHFQLAADDPHFSRRHFLIEVNPPRCLLIDLNSRNGTCLNGVRVKSAEMKDGDEIRAGSTMLRLKVIDDEDTDHKVTIDLPAPISHKEKTAEYKHKVQIPGYQIQGELGRGGMGVVYRAIRERDGQPIALKTIIASATTTQLQINRFLRECCILSELRACEFNGQTPCLIPENTGDYLVRRLD